MKGRSIAAVFAGIAAGAIIWYILAPMVGKMYTPDPEVLEAIKGDRKAFADLYRNQPASFHLLNIGLGILRLIAAMIVGSLIEKKDLMIPIIIAAFWLLMSLLDVLAWPNPMWYGFTYIPAIIAVTVAFVFWKRKAMS